MSRAPATAEASVRRFNADGHRGVKSRGWRNEFGSGGAAREILPPLRSWGPNATRMLRNSNVSSSWNSDFKPITCPSVSFRPLGRGR